MIDYLAKRNVTAAVRASAAIIDTALYYERMLNSSLTGKDTARGKADFIRQSEEQMKNLARKRLSQKEARHQKAYSTVLASFQKRMSKKAQIFNKKQEDIKEKKASLQEKHIQKVQRTRDDQNKFFGYFWQDLPQAQLKTIKECGNTVEVQEQVRQVQYQRAIRFINYSLAKMAALQKNIQKGKKEQIQKVTKASKKREDMDERRKERLTGLEKRRASLKDRCQRTLKNNGVCVDNTDIFYGSIKDGLQTTTMSMTKKEGAEDHTQDIKRRKEEAEETHRKKLQRMSEDFRRGRAEYRAKCLILQCYKDRRNKQLNNL